MEVHLCLWSTMSPKMTRANLILYGIEFDETEEGNIQRFRWGRRGPVCVSLWVTCQHPIVSGLASSLLPYMDACVCWYHDHDAISCIRVDAGMQILEKYNSNVWLMATAIPKVNPPHQSKIRKYFDDMGFERTRLTSSLDKNIEMFVKRHLQYKKDVLND